MFRITQRQEQLLPILFATTCFELPSGHQQVAGLIKHNGMTALKFIINTL
jgi:hypothetical protein